MPLCVGKVAKSDSTTDGKRFPTEHPTLSSTNCITGQSEVALTLNVQAEKALKLHS